MSPQIDPYKVRIGGVIADPYLIATVYELDPVLSHVLKKVLRAGRKHKSREQDVQEAILTLQRWLEIHRQLNGGDSSADGQRPFDRVHVPRSVLEIWQDPHLDAKREPLLPHAYGRVIGTMENSIDGSGPWISVHFFGPDNKFVQGGWLPSNAMREKMAGGGS